MFDIGAAELLLVVIVAILVIGPKDMPRAMRTAGRWIGKMRRMSSHFRSGIDEMVRQAEIEDMEKKWADRNSEIMAKYPTGSEPAGGAPEGLLDGEMQPLASAGEVPDADAAAEAAIKRAAPKKAPEHGGAADDEPGLPLGDQPPAPPPPVKGEG
ncbi:Sec-independent protein translocase protein TatB [Qipengyuania psychrotolerans]|uniref:Sec-independent protein translocase protein TatB n=1 Tax=Qipengyuania psychrotolerans TaxID=2867238 RepID=A0ABX8ZBP1_9SPHN|nr:Sec-independent protein translocase protein TatB [Qipengyuania psychrotolerans]QZD86421.1 Sec-independent protein translocase protein TatB [Qipengyuania psychrotolerans]